MMIILIIRKIKVSSLNNIEIDLNTVTREYNKEFWANYDQMTNYSEKYKKKSIGNKAQLNTKSVAYMYKQKQRQLKSGNYKFNA